MTVKNKTWIHSAYIFDSLEGFLGEKELKIIAFSGFLKIYWDFREVQYFSRLKSEACVRNHEVVLKTLQNLKASFELNQQKFQKNYKTPQKDIHYSVNFSNKQKVPRLRADFLAWATFQMRHTVKFFYWSFLFWEIIKIFFYCHWISKP